MTPDLSDFTTLNNAGNTPKVRDFWRRKFALDRAGPRRVHAEASHLLAKAGLLENLDLLTERGATIEVILLRRNVLATVWSFHNRFDFVSNGLAWAFYLDAAWPNTIVDGKPFLEFHTPGRALWYVIEMCARAAHYRQLMQGTRAVRFHTVDLERLVEPAGARKLLDVMDLAPSSPVDCPPPRNEGMTSFFGEQERESLARLVARFPFDEEDLARRFITSGRRLAHGAVARRPG